MTVYRDTKIMPFAAKTLFELVADVERYPEFVPFWKEARIVHREDRTYFTDQLVGIGPLRDRFQTVTQLDFPRHIRVTPHHGNLLFKRFHIEWNFESDEECSTRVQVIFDVEPYSLLLQRVVDRLARQMARGILTAFQHRAEQLA